MSKLKLFLPIGRMFLASECFAGAGSLGVLSAVQSARMAVLVLPALISNDEAMEPLHRALKKTVYTVIPAPTVEPTLKALEPVVHAVNEFRPDWIVAIGGGAVLDSGKLAWALYEHPALTPEQLARPYTLPALRGKARFIAVPTTAGSGSESSSAATFQIDENARKSFVVSHEFIPDIAILDPTLMRGVPTAVMARAGLDALAHAVEGYGSRFANAYSSAFATTAARNICRVVKTSVNAPDNMVARTDLLVAASMAGATQNFAVPGIGHAIAHALAAYSVPHALGTGALLGPAIAANSAASTEVMARYDTLAGDLGFDGATELARYLMQLATELGLTDDFRTALAVVDRASESFIDSVKADPCARANPVTVDSPLVAAVLKQVV